jgi:hypothetical protein
MGSLRPDGWPVICKCAYVVLSMYVHFFWQDSCVLVVVSPPCKPPSERPPRAPGILLRSRSLAQLSGSAPWLLGSLGTVLLDIVIFLQVPDLAPGHPTSWRSQLLALLGAQRCWSCRMLSHSCVARLP